MRQLSLEEVIRDSDADDWQTNDSADLASCINTLAREIVQLRARIKDLEQRPRIVIQRHIGDVIQ